MWCALRLRVERKKVQSTEVQSENKRVNNEQNPYYQPQGMPSMPPQGMPVPQGGAFMPPRPLKPRTWRERMMRRFGMDTAMQMPTKGALTIPNWIVGKSVVFFFISMIACWMAFGHVPGVDLWLVASISVVLFFYGGASMSRSWASTKEKRFLRNVFVAGFLVRLLWVLYCYFFFNPVHYGNTFGDTADVSWYMPFGEAIAQWIRNGFDGSFEELRLTWHSAIDDIGYPIWLGIVYWLTGSISDVFIPFFVKSIIGAYCAISIYRVAKRHFGEGAARLAALFVALNPNMVYWCGTMMKETEMVFFVCLAVDNFDRVLSSGKHYTFKTLLPGLLAGLALMFFRTVLGLVFFLAVFAHIVMASNRVMSMGKKILAGVLVAAVLAVSMGDRIRTQSEKLLDAAHSDSQKNNIEWRAETNSLAKYAGAAVFAPLIFTIPFPTMNQASELQLTQMLLMGGSYIKNIFSFFVILVLLMMLLSGEWRRHVFIVAYTGGYLMVLVMSAFAQSGRFHMPIMPILMLFAAYGVQIAKGNAKLKQGFTLVLVAEVLVCLAWNWFKLKGRGMI